MLWFHKDNQGTMRHRYKRRTGYAQLLQRDVKRPGLLAANALLAQQGFESADADEHEFTTLFGEPMPEHLRIAVHLETDLWVAVRTSLDGARNATRTAQHYTRLVSQVRRELTTLLKLLDLEQEIMHSPLSKQFHDQLKTLREAAT
jgi:hypothetical protein